MKTLIKDLAKWLAILVTIALACAFIGLCSGLAVGGCITGARIAPSILTPRK